MDKRIIYTRPDGGVSVVVPADHVTDLDELAQKVVPDDATNVRQITTANLPANRNYRDAWDDTNPGPNVGISLSKAKQIAHQRRRAKRSEVFAQYQEVLIKDAQGIPLGPGEDAAAARQAMTDYKSTVDDRTQNDIDTAASVSQLEQAERSYDIITK